MAEAESHSVQDFWGARPTRELWVINSDVVPYAVVRRRKELRKHDPFALRVPPKGAKLLLGYDKEAYENLQLEKQEAARALAMREPALPPQRAEGGVPLRGEPSTLYALECGRA